MRLQELEQDVAIIKTQLSTLAPTISHVTLPTHEEPITNQILAQDILCLVHQLGKILPQLEAFVSQFVYTVILICYPNDLSVLKKLFLWLLPHIKKLVSTVILEYISQCDRFLLCRKYAKIVTLICS